MPSPRKLYKQGNAVVVSFPFHLCRDISAQPGDFFLMRSIAEKTLIFELNKRDEVITRGAEYYRQIPFSALRSLYRQGNCLVLTIPKPMLEYHHAEIGDTVLLQWLAQGTLTGTFIKKEMREYQDARNWSQFRQHRTPTGKRPKPLPPSPGEC